MKKNKHLPTSQDIGDFNALIQKISQINESKQTERLQNEILELRGQIREIRQYQEKCLFCPLVNDKAFEKKVASILCRILGIYVENSK